MKKSPEQSALLDTNVVIAVVGAEPSAMQMLTRYSKVFVPVPVLGELYHGAEKSLRSAENFARIEQFTSLVNVLSCNAETAREYGRLKHQLWKKGNPIPENDLWIAAIASQHDITVLTRDKHFQAISGIKLQML